MEFIEKEKTMRNLTLIFTLAILFTITACSQPGIEKNELEKTSPQKWEIHDMNRPLPPVVDPGEAGPPVPPPADAFILFDGKDLSQWETISGEQVKWNVEPGYMEMEKETGNIKSIKEFGDCQLHLEWATPLPKEGEELGWGNSGVFLMGLYEIQVLDSYNKKNYADGGAAAVYGQYPPLVNACRPPGEWQTFDIVFHRPHFDQEGKLTFPARLTLFHNGILVQNDVKIMGPTAYKKRPPYKAHADKLPLLFQNYGDPVRYRNIWIRDLEKNPISRSDGSK